MTLAAAHHVTLFLASPLLPEHDEINGVGADGMSSQRADCR
jgi:hypothetical protein